MRIREERGLRRKALNALHSHMGSRLHACLSVLGHATESEITYRRLAPSLVEWGLK